MSLEAKGPEGTGPDAEDFGPGSTNPGLSNTDQQSLADGGSPVLHPEHLGDGGLYDAPGIFSVADAEPILALGAQDDEQLLCASAGPFPNQGVDLWGFDGQVVVLHGNGLERLELGKWAHVGENPDSHTGVVGYESSLLMTFGEPPAGCGIRQFQARGSTRCSAAAAATAVVLRGVDVGLAVSGDRVFIYDGEFWRQFGDPLLGEGASPTARSIWANDDTWVVAADIGLFRSDWRGGSVTFSPAPDGVDLNDVGVDDDGLVWAGSRDGRLLSHGDNGWHEQWVVPSSGDCEQASNRIEGVLVNDEGVFFHTRSELFLYRNGNAELLLRAECDSQSRIWSLWGDDANEVLVALEDLALETDRCGPVGVVRFDGDHFTRL